MPTTRIQIAKGWSSDRPPEEIPIEFLTECFNVLSKNKAAQRAFPFAQVGPVLTDKPRWLLPNQDTTGSAFWMVGCDTSVLATDLVTEQDITPAIWSDHTDQDQPYTGGVINQIPIINSPLDGPYFWDQDYLTPSLLEPLPDWPANDAAFTMRPFREFLFALGINRSGSILPDLLQWSDAAAPGDIPQSWTPSTATQAGEVSVSFNPGALIDGAQLVDRFFVYKTRSAYVMSLIGGQFVFSQRPVFSTVGCLARNCVVEWRGQHIVMGDGDVWIHDGLNVQSLISERLRREIFDSMSDENFANSYLALATSINALLICRPKDSEVYPSEAIVLNLDDFSFGHQALVFDGTPHAAEGLIDSGAEQESTWAEKTTLWSNDPTNWNTTDASRVQDGIALANYEGLVLDELGAGNDQDGTPLQALAERIGISLGEPTNRKFVRRVWPRFRGATDGLISISIGVQEFSSQDPTYGPAQQFRIGVDRFVNVNASGNFLAYKFESTDGLLWDLPAFDLDVEIQGRF